MKYKIFEEIKLVYVVAEGVLRFDDLMSHLDELANDPKYIPPMLKLVDYRNITEYELSTQEAEIFSEKKNSMMKHFAMEECAFVVPSDLGYGMARHHQAFIDENQIKTQIFRDIEEAKQWLGVDISEENLSIG